MMESPRFLLDTTALIDFAKGFEPAHSKILGMLDRGDQLAICCVSAAEFFTGLLPEERKTWRQFFAVLPYWDIRPEAAAQAGIWRYAFSRTGVQLSTTDALIAATAWQQDAILMTNNTKHYPMAEIQLMSARD